LPLTIIILNDKSLESFFISNNISIKMIKRINKIILLGIFPNLKLYSIKRLFLLLMLFPFEA
jgi:hypothetical protein